MDTGLLRPRATRPPPAPASALVILHDQVGTSVLIGLGALLQLLLSSLTAFLLGGSARRETLIFVSFLPTLMLLIVPLARRVAIACGIVANPYLAHTVAGRTTGKVPAHLPVSAANHGMGVVQIGFRSNGALGLADPAAQIVARNFQEMQTWLYAHAEESGFLTSESYLGTRRASQNTILVILYFATWQDIHKFAHGMHMKGWMEFARQSQANTRHIEIWHESYMVAKSESIYLNTEPTGMGNIWQNQHQAQQSEQKDGEEHIQKAQWLNGLQSLAKTSSAKERIGAS